MRKHLLFLLVAVMFAQANLMAQKTTTKFVQITTIESVIGGGIGRSKMIITKEDGASEEKDLNNLFSITSNPDE